MITDDDRFHAWELPLMTVGELRELLKDLPDDLPVRGSNRDDWGGVNFSDGFFDGLTRPKGTPPEFLHITC